MYVCTSVRPLSIEEITFRRRVLRDAIICIGWLKLLSIFCYAGLCLMVHLNSKGRISTTIKIMTLLVIPMQLANGVLLFLGALEIKILALEIALWLCIFVAAYNTLLGLMGMLYFIRTGYLTIHFLLCVVFAVLSLSIFTVLCHDVIVIYTFKSLLQEPRPLPPPPASIAADPSSVSPTPSPNTWA